MTRRNLMVVAAVLLLTGVLTAAGCDSDTASLQAGASQLYPVSVDGTWGFIDKTGAIKIEPRFVQARTFSEGLAAVEVTVGEGTKSGYIDTSGDLVVEPQFDYAGDFSEGLAVVANNTGLDGELFREFGYIDTSGAFVIPIERNSASSFSEGLAMFTVVDVDYPTYFLDKTGATVLGPFDFALQFCEGLAYVEWGSRSGFVDATGKRVIELPDGYGRCQHASCCFSEGLALVEFSDAGVERHVFVDRSGAVAFESPFLYAQDFSEGLAPAAVQEGDKTTWGYIDKTGAWVIDPRFYMALEFSEGLAAVMFLENDVITYGYIDARGTMVISPRQCAEAGPFSGGVAALMGLGSDTASQTPSYIDTTGKVIWQGR